MSLKKIDGNIARIGATGEKLNILIHTTAMLIAQHAAKHGDCTRALVLAKAMPASMRRTTLISWFAKYTPIRVVLVNDVVGMMKKEEKGFTPFALEKADAKPFYKIAETTPEAAAPLDFLKLVAMVESIGKRIDKSVEEGKVSEDDIPSAKAITAQLKALSFKRVKAVVANDQAPSNPKLAATS